MTKSQYIRSLNAEIELEQVKKERDALLAGLKELMYAYKGLAAVGEKRAELMNGAEKNARRLVASIESTKGE